MQKIYYLYYLIAILIILSCASEGEIEVQNKTSEWLDVKIDGGLYELQGYDQAKKSYDLTDYLVSAEETDATVSGEGLLKWEFSQNYNIKAGETETVKISADAGAIGILNNSTYRIVAVYLSPSSSGNWGGDDLTGIIYSGGSFRWTVSPGYWDIKVVNQYGQSSISYDNYVQIGNVKWFTYSMLNLTLKNIPIKEKQNFIYSIPADDRVLKYNPH